MKKISLFATTALMLAMITGCPQRQNSASSGGTAAKTNISGDKAETMDRLKDSANVLTELMNAPDQGIPEYVYKDAKCVAVVPSMVKGGFVFGARHGRGVATCRLKSGNWSAPAFFTVTGGSWGAQIGVETVDLVMLIMDDKGMQDLLNSKVKIGADASAAAGPVGRDAAAATDWKLESQVLMYSRAKGLFAGLTLNGANIEQDDDSTKAFYGKMVNFRTTLMSTVAPNAADVFTDAVHKNFHISNAKMN